MTHVDHVLWQILGFTDADRERWMALGVTNAQHADGWQRKHLPLDEVGAWVAAGVRTAGAGDPWRAMGLRPEQVPAQMADGYQYAFTVIAAVPCTAEWGALNGQVPTRVAAVGHLQGQGADAVLALTVAMAPALAEIEGSPMMNIARLGALTLAEALLPERTEALVAFACGLDGLDWATVALCLRAGMSPPEARDYVRAGRDMAPVGLMVALGPAA